ncbi:Short-chain dehydrogenase [Spirosomataceae bacterium TFI 002]|nr:Short-chain dehydrogenase [Spirosomataceae bacterium TFI 002]
MKVIIIGATSGIGRAVAEAYLAKGAIIGITGRRLSLLQEIQSTAPNSFHVAEMDVANIEESLNTLASLIETMGGVDILIINAGVGYVKATLAQEISTVDINVRGFTALARYAFDYFTEKGSGHLVGVSSVAAVKSSPYAPEYHASKAYMSSYMEGIRLRSAKWKHNVAVTDIRPGFVETAMTESNKNMFWVAKPEVAANYILKAIEQKKKVAYITPRYWFLAQFLKVIPDWLMVKVM